MEINSKFDCETELIYANFNIEVDIGFPHSNKNYLQVENRTNFPTP
jgi:hypothetical protein